MPEHRDAFLPNGCFCHSSELEEQASGSHYVSPRSPQQAEDGAGAGGSWAGPGRRRTCYREHIWAAWCRPDVTLVVQLSADQLGSRVPAVPGRPPRWSHTGAGTVCWEAYRLSWRVPLLRAKEQNQTMNLPRSLGIPLKRGSETPNPPTSGLKL